MWPQNDKRVKIKIGKITDYELRTCCGRLAIDGAYGARATSKSGARGSATLTPKKRFRGGKASANPSFIGFDVALIWSKLPGTEKLCRTIIAWHSDQVFDPFFDGRRMLVVLGSSSSVKPEHNCMLLPSEGNSDRSLLKGCTNHDIGLSASALAGPSTTMGDADAVARPAVYALASRS